jgi:phosphopantetheinyl transferase (holo-ACP synthase)
MLGNDVVVLREASADAATRHPRFDARAFTRAECALIASSGAPERLRAMLWAAKEAAYKVARKLDPRSVFAPSRYAVEVDAALAGSVSLPDGRRFALRIRGDAEYVHACASPNPDFEADLVCGVGAIGSGEFADESLRARSFALEALARTLGRPTHELRLAKRGRIPELRIAGMDTALDLSLSHHGRYAAFACALPPALPMLKELC